MRRKRNVKVMDELSYYTAYLHHRQILPDAIVAPWHAFNAMDMGG